MTEVKVRIWDLAMHAWADETAPFVLALESQESTARRLYRLHQAFMDPTPVDKSDRWIFMLYTGLKDRRGVEIYDGDIVRITRGLFRTARVEYLAKHGAWHAGTRRLNHEFAENCVVIGNVYEADMDGGEPAEPIKGSPPSELPEGFVMGP
jgi:hypothetical protein